MTAGLLPPLPHTQVLSSKTFSRPPLDGSLSLPELFDYHAEHSKDHRLFIFPQEDGKIRTIYWPEGVRAVHNGARIVRKVMGWQPGRKEIPVLAILSPSDAIPYFTFVISILRAGYAVFPISPRNSPAAVAHLLNKVGVSHVFIGHEPAMEELAKQSLKILSTEYQKTSLPELSPLPLFPDLFLDSQDDPDDIPFEKRGLDEIVVYMHSSGSTNFPKPIPWPNRRLIEISVVPYFGERDICDMVFSWHVVPMYHVLGLVQASWTVSTGKVGSAFLPKYPPQIPTPQSHFEAAFATNTDVIFCASAIIEAWARKPDYVKWMTTRSGVIFGGGPLSKEVGDYLVSQGVKLFSAYGMTEGGVVNPILPAQADKDWEYFPIASNIVAKMVPYDEGLYELVLISSPFNTPSLFNTKVDGVDAYATSDLFEQHPTRPELWKVYGRSDDQIMHSTGEKTNPGPLEDILNRDPHIQSSVMFGRGQFQAGVIIDPKPEFKFDPSDEAKLAEFRNKIWPTVQRLNEFAPQHSRLFKEMITVAKPSKPFQYTAKGTPRRVIIINEYAQEIKALYDAVADSTQSNIPPPAEWTLVATTDFVRQVVVKVLNHDVKDDDDIFQHGGDSLQATWIRNSLLRALQDSADIDTRHLVDNFVYDHPTISSLAQFIYSLVTGGAGDPASESERRVAAMWAMVEKYTSSGLTYKAPATNGAAKPLDGDVVLVTGTTGGLGAYLLAELVASPSVARVYAVNRPSKSSSDSVRDRQEKSLLDRGLDAAAILGSKKFKLVEADMAVRGFGVPTEVYEEIKSSVTHIIHNAWPVDFNLALASFEKSIKSVRFLVDLALSSPLASPPTLLFTSTIGVFQNTASIDTDLLPEEPIAPEVAIGTGYSESKWVTEEILQRVSKQTPLRTVTVRVGQITGGINGAWNTSEWFPALVQSVPFVKCFPGDERIVDWIPLSLAAKAVVDFREAGSSSIVHLVHPHPTTWSSLSKVITKELGVEAVPFAIWLMRLEELAKTETGDVNVEAMRRIPALRLLPFFRYVSAPPEKGAAAGLGFKTLDTKVAVQLSKTLADPKVPQLADEDIKSWLRYWKSVGFLTDKVN